MRTEEELRVIAENKDRDIAWLESMLRARRDDPEFLLTDALIEELERRANSPSDDDARVKDSVPRLYDVVSSRVREWMDRGVKRVHGPWKYARATLKISVHSGELGYLEDQDETPVVTVHFEERIESDDVEGWVTGV